MRKKTNAPSVCSLQSVAIILPMVAMIGCSRKNPVTEAWLHSLARISNTVTNSTHLDQVRTLARIPDGTDLFLLEPVGIKGDTACCIFEFKLCGLSEGRRWFLHETYYYDPDLPMEAMPIKLAIFEIDSGNNCVVRHDV